MKLNQIILMCFAISGLGLCSLQLMAAEPKTVAASQAQPQPMAAPEILALVHQINQLQNKAMLTTSVKADVDALFALYSADFEYVHEKYGGSYSRDLLYRNTLKAVETKRFKDSVPRYQIEAVLPGLNAAAVRRYQQTGTPAYHLAVFEFADGKVRRIVEYW
ncbi:hypothetical protein EOE67_05330 [Rheinheimera riviphila]|uniref:SnoaL-like domain-containing protein n=1 Tax=Rheinheimera riviphila TaxID=1834037 RepID=A0A437R173_9GAMM|nr:hypothetical protein [Rheinheimera riviphila]RVU40473.1 hypothetical protein EOE67_05330 [Rheinheimera riviphila]